MMVFWIIWAICSCGMLVWLSISLHHEVRCYRADIMVLVLGTALAPLWLALAGLLCLGVRWLERGK